MNDDSDVRVRDKRAEEKSYVSDIARDLALFLERKQFELTIEKKRIISQTEMARICKIPQGSMSQYMNGTRVPNDENADKLAAQFGVVIYDILRKPRKMPDDPMLREIAEVWGELPGDLRKKHNRQILDDYQAWVEQKDSIAGEIAD